MAHSGTKCVLCFEKLSNPIKINPNGVLVDGLNGVGIPVGKNVSSCRDEILSSSERKKAVSRWKFLCLESFNMLYGLPINHPVMHNLFPQREVIDQLCNSCIDDISKLHYIFWQLHNLETKLFQLQTLIFQRLEKNFEPAVGIKMECFVEGGGEEDEVEKFNTMQYNRAKSLFDVIKTFQELWPKDTYTSRWKEAEEYFEQNYEHFTFPIIAETEVTVNEDCEQSDDNEVRSDPDFIDDATLDNRNEDDFDWDYESEVRREKTSNLRRKPRPRKSRMKYQPLTKVPTGNEELVRLLCVEDPSICSRTYSQKKDLTKHIQEFHVGRTHICDHEGCVEKFLSEGSLKWHRIRAHGFEREKKYLCKEDPELCNGAFYTNKELSRHIKTHHKGRTHICDHEGCVEKFVSERSLKWHRIRAHGFEREKKYLCKEDPELCSGAFYTNKELSKHTKTFHKGCREKFSARATLTLQKDKVRGDHETTSRTRICEICGELVRYKNWYNHRYRYHHAQNLFTCERCSMELPNKEEFETHVKLHSQFLSTFPFTCVIPNCQSVLSCSLELKAHVICEHLSNWLQCPYCDIKKPTEYLLKRHMKNHEKVKNWVCDECPRRFVSQSALQYHKQQIHTTNTTKYTCEVCEKGYSSKKNVVRHMKIHKDKGDFKCLICSKMFYYAQSLKKHEEIHSGTKKYECELCGKRFKQLQNLRQHLKTQQHQEQKPTSK